MDAAASVRPSAAVATGSVLCICRARSVRSRLQMAAACTMPSVEMALTILSAIIMSTSFAYFLTQLK